MGETHDVEWTIPANSVQGSIAVGGTLASLEDRLVFAPHGVERALNAVSSSVLGKGHAEVRELRYSDIASVGKTERDFGLSGLMAGGIRIRLLITLESGAQEIFVVDDIDEVIQKISQRLGA